jgi:preprotein translocase subunit SecD
VPDLELTDATEGTDLKLVADLQARRPQRSARHRAQAEHHHAAATGSTSWASPSRSIQQQGADRIVVQLPGVQDTAKAKDILGRTATLEARLV